jgi:hypothetical protein
MMQLTINSSGTGRGLSVSDLCFPINIYRSAHGVAPRRPAPEFSRSMILSCIQGRLRVRFFRYTAHESRFEC